MDELQVRKDTLTHLSLFRTLVIFSKTASGTEALRGARVAVVVESVNPGEDLLVAGYWGPTQGDAVQMQSNAEQDD